MDGPALQGGGPPTGGRPTKGRHRPVTWRSRASSGEALLGWATVLIVLGGLTSVMNDPLSYALMFTGSVFGGAGLLRK